MFWLNRLNFNDDVTTVGFYKTVLFSDFAYMLTEMYDIYWTKKERYNFGGATFLNFSLKVDIWDMKYC